MKCNCAPARVLEMMVLTLFIFLLTPVHSLAQHVHTIDASGLLPQVQTGGLQLGGKNKRGDEIAVNNHYLSLNGKPFIPITGEFHFSRYPNQYWEEAILKMKAGGINVMATYVFWNIHEEREGVFRWDGDRDLRRFIALCAKHNLHVIVRIGPFCHGEIRNGGLPDWLLGRPLNIRSNDPAYLTHVQRLYKQIGGQLRQLYFKDNGPVIGIQIENEYQHSAAPWGLTYPSQPHDWTADEKDLSITKEGVSVSEEKNSFAALGNEHMKVLKSLAVQAGLDVPLYTATGWGNAAIIPHESIPVTAAYAYPFWTPRKDISPFFLYKDMHKQPDYAPVRYQPEDYPVFAAELGSGIMGVYTRRPIAVHKSFDALINRCLGSGANGIGYYMYHGGSTPRGEQNYFSDEAYGLPKISYDFQAPIGEYGQVREGFHRLKLLHWFLQDFGDVLAPMHTVLPGNANELKPENVTDLRYAVRTDGKAGFLFLNNFQDDTTVTRKENIQVSIKTSGGTVSIPESGGFDLAMEENAIFPFNINLNGAQLIYATAQLMMKGSGYCVFFRPEGMKAEFSFAATPKLSVEANEGIAINKNSSRILVSCKEPVTEFVLQTAGKTTRVLVIDKSLALTANRIKLKGKESLLFSAATVLQDGETLALLSEAANRYDVSFYPRVSEAPVLSYGRMQSKTATYFSNFSVEIPASKLTVQPRQISRRKYAVKLPSSFQNLNDVFLQIDYTGDTGMGFLDGKLAADEFYTGLPWRIGLKRFYPAAANKEMVFYFRPLMKGSSFLSDLNISDAFFGKVNSLVDVKGFALVPDYKTTMRVGPVVSVNKD